MGSQKVDNWYISFGHGRGCPGPSRPSQFVVAHTWYCLWRGEVTLLHTSPIGFAKVSPPWEQGKPARRFVAARAYVLSACEIRSNLSSTHVY